MSCRHYEHNGLMYCGVPDSGDATQFWDYVTCLQCLEKRLVPDPTNPKDLIGSKKVSLTKLPPIAHLYGSRAMMDGAQKYGPYNWRDKKVRAEIYIDACLRHIYLWQEGQENAEDSGVHHLGHAIACLAIILDAQAMGNLLDDRPLKGEAFARVLDALNGGLK